MLFNILIVTKEIEVKYCISTTIESYDIKFLKKKQTKKCNQNDFALDKKWL